MKQLYLVTGAAGHLGGTILRILKDRGEDVRGLILPSEQVVSEGSVQYVPGDVRDYASLEAFFSGAENRETIVIHTAGIVDISGAASPILYDVNVGGTRNIVRLCLEHHVKRLVYVSSVHAIPEKDQDSVLTEVREFSAESVRGGYAKTKAEATQVVLDATECGLDAVVVHPSGIIGPYGDLGNHMVQLVSDYISGKLPACVQGGYDFVDVRDVAEGCLTAAERGVSGECYILSNRHYEVREILRMVKHVCGGRLIPTLPMWIARAAEPLLRGFAKLRKCRPLYTKYSLYTLQSNDKFSHDKATAELGYCPRDLYQTVRDTVAWLKRKKLDDQKE